MCALFARKRALLEGFPRFRGYIASKQLFVRGWGGGKERGSLISGVSLKRSSTAHPFVPQLRQSDLWLLACYSLAH